MDTTRCEVCTEPERSQVHRNIDPQAVRGPWDIPHHKYEAPAGAVVPEWVRRAQERDLPVKAFR